MAQGVLHGWKDCLESLRGRPDSFYDRQYPLGVSSSHTLDPGSRGVRKPMHDLGHLLLVGGSTGLIVSVLSAALVVVRRRYY